MSVSVKRFRLRDPSMENREIAEQLGHGVRHGYSNPAAIFSVDLRWVGSRETRESPEILTLYIHETELHQAARQFADEIGER